MFYTRNLPKGAQLVCLPDTIYQYKAQSNDWELTCKLILIFTPLDINTKSEPKNTSSGFCDTHKAGHSMQVVRIIILITVKTCA